LRTAVANLYIDDAAEFKIFIKIFANFSSLGSSTVARDFRRGFTEAEPGFEFIDVDCNTRIIASKVEGAFDPFQCLLLQYYRLNSVSRHADS
jgi:hypothetical protein